MQHTEQCRDGRVVRQRELGSEADATIANKPLSPARLLQCGPEFCALIRDDEAFAVPRSEIERWRREYNEERPKKALGGLTPAAYAKQLK